jgi:pimeloyl-ACP methyl ester carboxylesterase
MLTKNLVSTDQVAFLPLSGSCFHTLASSYNGINSNGSLKPYSCADTITPSLTDEITSLNDEINNALKSNPNTDVYLVGHSLGGDVAFGYAAELLANPNLLPAGAKLKAVITLDAQLGGLKPSLTYDSIETMYFLVRCFAVFPHIMLTPANLTAVFRSAASTPPPEDGPRGSDPQGAQANILTNTDLSNENIAEQLRAAGTSFLSIGATNDFLHNPKSCLSIAPDFTGTQFLEDEGHGSGLYGRSFVAMSNGKPQTCHQISSKAFSCIQPLNPLDPFSVVEAAKQLACLAKEGTKFVIDIVEAANDINHSHQAVRTDPNVITAINNFLTSIPVTGVGGTPSPLAPVPGKDTGPK